MGEGIGCVNPPEVIASKYGVNRALIYVLITGCDPSHRHDFEGLPHPAIAYLSPWRSCL